MRHSYRSVVNPGVEEASPVDEETPLDQEDLRDELHENLTSSLVSEIVSSLPDRIARHPNMANLVRREVASAIAAQRPIGQTALAVIESKSGLIARSLIFLALLGVATYAGVLIVKSFLGPAGR